MTVSAKGPYATRPGTRFPPGATVTENGINFCIFSPCAQHAELLLYLQADNPEPYQIIVLDPEQSRSFFFWHVFVEGLAAGTHYTWKLDGPTDTKNSGRRFNAKKELVDPWARVVTDAVWDRQSAKDRHDAGHTSLRGVATAPLLHIRTKPTVAGLEGAVIYEMHVGGFTRHPSSTVRHPGTYAALKEKIPYLKELGITHVELLPVMAFDEQDVPPVATARGLRNFWGYSTHSFFAPHPGYCIDPENADLEFRDFVAAFHDAGLRVLMDVVYNHTAEGGDTGPVINFKGMANEIFYHLDAEDRNRYRDYTGCGNTVNCNHPLVSAFIVHSLEYWVKTLGVDGFRFDLASVFARGDNGALLSNPPLPWNIEASDILAPLPMIAEAWDAAGLYQVGAFPGMAWSEWNGRYRDVLRRFIRGEPGLIGEMATRIAGSSDLYADNGRQPINSINFITCHDGFTLHDLVSYNNKHNEANGEDDRDGSNDNLSWNCGVEGITRDPAVLKLRRQQAKNFMAILMLSRGVPMILAGDEVLRTQGGNNNAYCQDNELSWFDWQLTERNRDMLRFTRELIALRQRHPALTVNRYLSDTSPPGRNVPGVSWHGLRLHDPGWHDANACFLAFTLAGLTKDEVDLHVILNMSEQTLDAPLPQITGRRWYLAVDTAANTPDDIVAPDDQRVFASTIYNTRPRSVIVLEARH